MTPDEVCDKYRVLLGGRSPLNSQLQAAEVMQRSGRAIAVLPTGSAKTLLATLPFAAGIVKPRQMIFMTPLRSLTSAQAATLRDPREIVPPPGRPWDVREQTGSTPEDPLFCSPITVTTFDQALSSALQIAYSTGRGRRAINAGAILTSYLVADEVHLFPRDQALTTLLWLLRNRPDLPFLLMTATMTRLMAERLANIVRAELLLPLGDSDRQKLGISERRRIVHWQETPIFSADIEQAVAAGHKRILVVVNTVARATDLGRALQQTLGNSRVLVLHSRFYSADRKRIERDVRDSLGKDPAMQRSVVVIATQVVEVGLDISADLLLTEVAPANALVQRWGRCARWGGFGVVWVHPPVDGKLNQVLPYVGEGQDAVVARTIVWLRENATNGIEMDGISESAFLEVAHAEDDAAWLDRLQSTIAQRPSRIGEVSGHGEYTAAGELIRSVDQRTVLIHGRPEELGPPFRLEGFGLGVGQLYRFLGKGSDVPVMDDDDMISFDLPPEIPWRVRLPFWNDGEFSERRAETPTGWKEATAADLRFAPLVLVNPILVGYDPFLGLQLGGGQPATSEYWARSTSKDRGGGESYSYIGETFDQHVGRMLDVYARDPVLEERISAIGYIVEEFCGWPPGMLDRVIRASIVLHDVGKLTPDWTRYIRQYQRAGGHGTRPWLVHTDAPKSGTRPPRWSPPKHALAGAAHTLGVGKALDQEAAVWSEARDRIDPARPSAVLFTAILTHHSPDIGSLVISASDRIEADARAVVEAALLRSNLAGAVKAATPDRPLDRLAVNYSSLGLVNSWREWVALAVVIRALRLADGWSQESNRWEVS